MEQTLKKIKVEGYNAKPFEGKYGPSFKVGIKTVGSDNNEYWLNGFMKQQPTWANGDEVELLVWNDPKWGWSFKVPTQTKLLWTEVNTLKKKIAFLESIVMGKQEAQQVPPPIEELANDFGGEVINNQ